MAEFITYGEGGFDPDKPDNNVVARFTVDDPEPVAPDPLATLIADLSKATTLAQVRAAAAKAADLG
jgi:hypothetical protein